MPFYHSSRKAPPRPDKAALRKADDTASPSGRAQPTNPPDLDLIDLEPLPLDDAAEQLEMAPEELLKAFRAGAYRGFVDEGTLYIYVPAGDAGQGPEDRQEAAAETAAAPSDAERREIERLKQSAQQQEIDRLRKANRELQEEKDRLFRLLEREQVLRQGIQRTLDRAWINLLPPMETPPKAAESIQTIDRYAKEPQEPARRTTTEDEALDIGSFLGGHD